jgi:hypothetical protein
MIVNRIDEIFFLIPGDLITSLSDMRESAGQFVNNRNSRSAGCAGEWVEIDCDYRFPHVDQSLTTVPIFKRHKDDICRKYTLTPAPCPVMGKRE